MAVKMNECEGYTVGRRDNGARCVLWSDDSIEWFSAEDFAQNFPV